MFDSFEALHPSAWERTPVCFYDHFRAYRLIYTINLTVEEAIKQIGEKKALGATKSVDVASFADPLGV
jgi:hypothetical protein